MAEVKKDKNGNEDFFAVCAYIEQELLNYEPNQKLQRNAALRVRGLSSGQTVANNQCNEHGEYPYEVILIVLKLYKKQILNSLKKINTESENGKVAYICAIVRDKLNYVYSRYIEIKHAQEESANIDTNIIDHKGAEYTPPTPNKNKTRLKEFW